MVPLAFEVGVVARGLVLRKLRNSFSDVGYGLAC